MKTSNPLTRKFKQPLSGAQWIAAIVALAIALTIRADAQESVPQPAVEIVSPDPSLTAEAKYERARNLVLGQGVPRDIEQAYRLMLEASGEGHAEATGAIGLFYQKGWAGLPQNNEEAARWYRKGHEMGGLRAGYNYGIMLMNGLGVETDLATGMPLIKKAVEAGLPEANLVYGSYYYYGKFGKAQDDAKAFELMKVAADAGNPHAENMMGIMFEHGRGTKPDANQAIEWYRKAANQNIAKAQANLGILLGTETTEPERRAEALKWLQIAAGNNEITGQKTLQAIQLTIRPDEMDAARREALKFQLQMIRSGRPVE
jgi:uncharacterized protein